MSGLGWKLERVASIVGCEAGEARSVRVETVSIDSRQDCRGALFVALRGERFDGHDFVAGAAERGAVAALVSRPVEGVEIPLLQVDDTLRALQSLAVARRREVPLPLLAITGSNGKTTTRMLAAEICGRHRRVHQPTRNFNNQIGLPLTLLGIEAEHEAAIVEIGCSDFGEIEELTELALPDAGLVTNVGPAHLERLGDLDGVARAKGELLAGLPERGTAVINADDLRVSGMRTPARRRITYGRRGGVDVRLVASRSLPGEGRQLLELEVAGESVEADLALLGEHNAGNAVAAAAGALALGCGAEEIAAGLSEARGVSGRLRASRAAGGWLVIDDSYNANPGSWKAAIEVLRELAGEGRKLVVLGDMLELGEAAAEEHRRLGSALVRSGAESLLAVGNYASEVVSGARGEGGKRVRAEIAADAGRAAERAKEQLEPGDVVLVKGSRGMRMERAVTALLGKER
ncbi:MAG: UDP-N-acetylmuramoyl-tripeptide--D-alanyl-D-alanine ligase [Polyangia bacterium]